MPSSCLAPWRRSVTAAAAATATTAAAAVAAAATTAAATTTVGAATTAAATVGAAATAAAGTATTTVAATAAAAITTTAAAAAAAATAEATRTLFARAGFVHHDGAAFESLTVLACSTWMLPWVAPATLAETAGDEQHSPLQVRGHPSKAYRPVHAGPHARSL